MRSSLGHATLTVLQRRNVCYVPCIRCILCLWDEFCITSIWVYLLLVPIIGDSSSAGSIIAFTDSSERIDGGRCGIASAYTEPASSVSLIKKLLVLGPVLTSVAVGADRHRPSFLFAVDLCQSLWFVYIRYADNSHLASDFYLSIMGESEYWFALIKVLMVVVFIFVGLIYDWGGVKRPSRTSRLFSCRLKCPILTNSLSGSL
jgi:hypothetical protein